MRFDFLCKAGFFSSSLQSYQQDITCSVISNTQFDLSDIIHGFQRVGTVGLAYEKLLMYHNKKLVIYHLPGFGQRKKGGKPTYSYVECTIPHDYRDKISSCQFSTTGQFIVCGTYSGEIFIQSSDHVFGRLSSVNYENLLKETKAASYPQMGLRKALKEVEQKAVSQNFFDMHLQQSGITMLTAVNMPDDKGNTLVTYSTVDRNQYLVAYILKWAKKYGAWLDINIAAEGPAWNEVHRGNLSDRPQPSEDFRGASLKLLVESMMQYDQTHGWIISPQATAKVMPLLFPYLVDYFPSLAIWLLKQPNFTPENSLTCSMPIPDLFASLPRQNRERLQVEKHEFLTHWKPHKFWEVSASYEEVIRNDEGDVMELPHVNQHKKLLKKVKRQNKDNIEAPAESQVLLFQGAARRNTLGIIGPLITAPHTIDEAFDTPAVLAVIRLKWKLFGEKVLVFELVLYMLFVQSYIVYSLLDVPFEGEATSKLTIRDTFERPRFVLSTFITFINIIISLVLNYQRYGPFYLEFIAEFKQTLQSNQSKFMNLYISLQNQIQVLVEVLVLTAVAVFNIVFLVKYDKFYHILIDVILAVRLTINEFIQLQESGFWNWIASGWNIFDAISYTFLYVIFAFEVGGLNDTLAQSVLISMEAIFLWPKILSYLRAFRQTGPTIQMIIEVFKDTAFFLVLLLIIVIGFGIAFFSLFGTEQFLQSNSGFDNGDIDFDSILPTFLAVIAFMAGDFEQGTYTTGSIWWWSMIMFIAFFLLMIIVLLNLLIALLGDSYSRIKNNESARFMRGRAEILDDLESSLFFISGERWEDGYVQLLVPKKGEETDLAHVGEDTDWEGSVQRTLSAIKGLPERIVGNLLGFIGVGTQRDPKREGSVKLRRTEKESLASRIKSIEDDVTLIKQLLTEKGTKND
eukprot:TRINITY_DN5615_c1_g1_i2.p1 TRINITY_DN5615_c1_g1~~TRINITY_DN5615_c1_g1_i2.p1  ORF type:complete len:912 (+),score=63.60 TRINITY_DN5615_c1_g1_i2:1016-3751(+)